MAGPDGSPQGGQSGDAPEISRSVGQTGGVVVFWPRIVPRSVGGDPQMHAIAQRLQERLAAKEIEQIDKQIVAAQIRLELANLELQMSERQAENALTVEERLRDKFTNEDLYGWMVSQTAAVYFQAYKLAFDLAKRAKALNLDAIHDTVHEMARDEARHGKAFAGLLKRYFG